MTQVQKPQKRVTQKSKAAHAELEEQLEETNNPGEIMFKRGNAEEVTISLLAKIHNQLAQLNRQLLEMNFYCSFMAPEEHRKGTKG